MPDESLATLAERARQQWNQQNLDGYLDLYAPTIVAHGLPGVEPGIENLRRFYESVWTGFPGCRLLFDDSLTEGNKLALRFRMEGTHQGTFMDIPPTGKEIRMSGITILRFEGDTCVERWTEADFLGMLQQLGAIPPPG
jgi:predicted ester cyclase